MDGDITFTEGAPSAIGYFSDDRRVNSRIPKGGHKIACEECGAVLKTKPDFAKSMCEFVARANGWRSKNGSNAWRCPKHLRSQK